MKSLKANLHGVLMGAFEVLVGILLIIDPEGFTSGIIVAIGIALLFGGIWQVVQYFKQCVQPPVKKLSSGPITV